MTNEINVNNLSEMINDKADIDLSNTQFEQRLDDKYKTVFTDFDLLFQGWQSGAAWNTVSLSHPYDDYKFLIFCYGTGSTQNHDICQTMCYVPALKFLSSDTTNISDYGNFCYGYDQIYIRVMVDDITYPNKQTIKVWTNSTGLKYIFGVN